MTEQVRGPRGIVGARTRVVAQGVKRLTPAMSRYFRGFERRMISGKSLAWYGIALKDDTPKAPSINWKAEERRLREILQGHYETIAEATYGVVSEQVGAEVAFDLSSRNLGRVMKDVAVRVTGINEVSRDRIRSLVKAEIESGANADHLEKQLRTLVRSWAGLEGPVSMSEDDRRSLSAAERMARSRAHSISLTETGNAFNRSAVAGYRDSGLVTQVLVFDGPECGWSSHDSPDLANRSTRSLSEAEAQPLAHPHCQRAFGPLVNRNPR